MMKKSSSNSFILSFFRLFLFVLSVVMLTYVFFTMFSKARVTEWAAATKEGFETTTISHMIPADLFPEVTSIDVTNKYKNIEIKDCFVKSSYDSAYTGSSKTIDTNALLYLISKGYRFFDFQVFLVDGLPVVGYGNPSENSLAILSNNTVNLSIVLYNIVTNVFKPPTPNARDPVFIQLRIQANDRTVYDLIGKTIEANLAGSLYGDKVTPTTQVRDLMNKIVLIVDKGKKGETAEYTAFKKKYANLSVSSGSLLVSTYDDLREQATTPVRMKKEDGHQTNKTGLLMAIPDPTKKAGNPDVAKFTKSYGCNFVAAVPYHLDSALNEYEKYFSDAGMAVCPFKQIL